MIVIGNTGGLAHTNAFLVADPDSRQAVLFDAPDHTVGPILDEAQRRGFDLIGLWLTHGHFDHMADHLLVKERFPNAKVLIHPLDVPKLDQPNSSVFQLPFSIAPCPHDGLLADGQMLKIGAIDVQVIHTPGHAPGHVCFYMAAHNVLIGGDLIIGGAVGRTDLPDSNHDDLNASIRTIMKLPGQTHLLPGHGTPGTLDHELQTNDYVQEALAGE